MNQPINVNGLNHTSEQPLMNPAAALPSLPYATNISDNQVQSLVANAREQLLSHTGTIDGNDALKQRAVGADELGQRMNQTLAANPAAAQAFEQQILPGGNEPTRIDRAPVTDESQIAQAILGPQAAALLGLGAAPAAPAPAAPPIQATSPSPFSPPATPTPPQQSVVDQQIAALTAQMQQIAQMQQFSLQQQQQAQATAAQQAQARQAAAWKDPAVRDAALQQIGINVEDAAQLQMGRFVHDTFHQQREENAQMRAALQQQGQYLQQMAQVIQGFQSGAQTVTLQSQLTAQVAKDFATAAPAAREQIVQNTLELAQRGLSPQDAYSRAAGPLRAHLQQQQQQQPRQPAPPPSAVVNAIALGGGGLGAAPVLPGNGRQFQQQLPSLPGLDAMFAQMLLGGR